VAAKLLAADSPFAAPNEPNQVKCVLIRQFGFDLLQGVFELQAGTIKHLVCLLERSHLGQSEAGAFEADDIETFRLDIESGIKEEGRDVEIHSRIAADHGETADLRILMNHDAARNERLILDFDVARNKSAAGNHGVVPDLAVMRDVTGGHDVIAIADSCHGFRLRAARDRVVFADLVIAPDAQVTPMAFEVLVQWISTQHGSGGDFIAVPKRGPAFDEDVGFEQAVRSDLHILLDHAELADPRASADDGFGMDARGWSDNR